MKSRSLHFSTSIASIKRPILLAASFLFLFSGVFGILTQEVSAAQYSCAWGANPSLPVEYVMFQRLWGCGYFNNQGNNSNYPNASYGAGTNSFLLPNGLGGINNVSAFESMVLGGLSGDTRAQTVSEFYILSMTGTAPGNGGIHNTGAAWAKVPTWENDLRGYSIYGENGSTSWGPNGFINWYQPMTTHCSLSPNNVYQDSADSYYTSYDNDVHPYWVPKGSKATANDPESCTGPYAGYPEGSQSWTGVWFHQSNGQDYYLDRLCGNARISTDSLNQTSLPNYTLAPTVNAVVNGADQGTGNIIAEPGNSLQFKYNMGYSGNGESYPCVNVNSDEYLYGSYQAGSQPYPAPPGATAGGPVNGCYTYTSSQTPIATDNFFGGSGIIPPGDTGKTICAWLGVSAASYYNGPPAGSMTCVFIANKPYFTSYGGDISVGQPATCSKNANTLGQIISWNQGSGSFTGAGVQFAAYAMGTLNDFATAQGGAAGGASPPAGLAVTNTGTNIGSGNYGGGSNPVTPCIPDYYGRKPGSTLPISSGTVSGDTGTYASATDLTITGGTMDPGQKTAIYVDGDVYISGNIVYGGNWSIADIPSFELVVQGNIYIAPTVSQLDGIYIAQQDPANPSTTGTIYTCATSSAGVYKPAAIDGSLYSTCDQTKLTFNGAVVANSIQLLRTIGTLAQSSGDSNGNDNAAEVFNYNPAVWLTAPLQGSGLTGDYDAITSLPPVL